MSGRFVNGAWVETDGYEFVDVPIEQNIWNEAVTTLMADHAKKCDIIEQYETMPFLQRLKFLISPGSIRQ